MAGYEMTDCTVGDVAATTRNALVGGPFGSDLVSRDYVPSGVPVIRGANMGHGRWVDGEFVYVTAEKADSLTSNCAKPGDLVFTQRGTLGQVALVPKKGADRYLISQSQMKVTLNPEKADALFLYYVFISPEQQAYIRQNAITTGVPHTNLGILRNTPISLPPLTAQKAIASILGALDDKIELNRKMNATLEAMARALFKSWFVDFDPVRAKLDGRKPFGMDDDTAALFPDSFQDSELGPIPKGWKIQTIEGLCDVITSGGTPARTHKAYWEPATIPWFKTGELLDGPLIDAQEMISEEGLANSSCKLWPAGTILFALYASPTVGRFGVLTKSATANQAAAALIAKPDYGVPFLMGLLYEARAELQRVAVGAAQQNINQGVLKSHAVIAPPPLLAKTYTDKVAPWFEQRIKLAEQSRTLATLRDMLLPKLLSGDLR